MKLKKNVVGVWIDYRKAVIVMPAGDKTDIQTIYSGAERTPRFKGETSKRHTRFSTGFDYESAQNNRFEEQMKKYYKAVIRQIGNSSSIYICGPGEAKASLEKEMKSNSAIAARIRGVKACDKLTTNQLIAHVKDFYSQTKV